MLLYGRITITNQHSANSSCSSRICCAWQICVGKNNFESCQDGYLVQTPICFAAVRHDVDIYDDRFDGDAHPPANEQR